MAILVQESLAKTYFAADEVSFTTIVGLEKLVDFDQETGQDVRAVVAYCCSLTKI